MLGGLTVALVAGCGELDTNVVGAPPEGFVPRVVESGPTAGYPTEPPGGFGGEEGDVIQNMVFSGFFSEDPVAGGVHQLEYRDGISFQDVREIGGYSHLLLNIGAEWCKPCRVEAVVLRGLYPSWAERGGYVLGVINQNQDYDSAGRFEVESWSRQYETPYTLVHDPEGYVAATLNPSTVPLNIVIDLETMEILRSKAGEDAETLTYFESLLGPR